MIDKEEMTAEIANKLAGESVDRVHKILMDSGVDHKDISIYCANDVIGMAQQQPGMESSMTILMCTNIILDAVSKMDVKK